VVHGFHNQRVLLRPVVPVSREQADAGSILRAAGRALGGHWKGGFDEGETRYDEHFAIFRAARPGVESAKKSPADSGANTGEWEISRVAAFPGQASSGLDRPLRHALRTKQR
jgi:hypothetical protein